MLRHTLTSVSVNVRLHVQSEEGPINVRKTGLIKRVSENMLVTIKDNLLVSKYCQGNGIRVYTYLFWPVFPTNFSVK